jgi:hypothetical protein
MSSVTALVLAGRGGPRLARTLESIDWVRDRVVWDMTGRLPPGVLPPGVRHIVGPPHDVESEGWILLLREGELASAALAPAIAGPIAASGGACRLPIELRAFGARLRPRYAPLRLARSRGARVVCGPGLVPELATADRQRRRLDVPLVVAGAGSLAEAVDDLEADAATLAVLLRRDGRRARVHHLWLPPLTACLRVLLARGEGRTPWTRWVIAVLAGYTSMVAWAKRWEQMRMEGAA